MCALEDLPWEKTRAVSLHDYLASPWQNNLNRKVTKMSTGLHADVGTNAGRNRNTFNFRADKIWSTVRSISDDNRTLWLYQGNITPLFRTSMAALLFLTIMTRSRDISNVTTGFSGRASIK